MSGGVPQQEQYQSGQQDGEGGFAQKCGVESVTFDYGVLSCREENDGQTGAGGGVSHGEADVSLKPAPDEQRQGDHAPPGISQTG